MAIFLLKTTTPDAIVTDIDSGTLWGVSLGTTTKRSTYSDYVLVECTKTRSENLFEACPESVSMNFLQAAPESFTESDQVSKVWYLRGML
jgi:hypothetical protein